jgi:hypothetical protein
MTHCQLRELGIIMALAVAVIALSGCANPWFGGPSAGGVSFEMTQDGVISYKDNGRDLKGLRASVSFPNGANATVRLDGATGSASADNATNNQSIIMQALIAKLLSPAELAKLAATIAAMSAGVPPIP